MLKKINILILILAQSILFGQDTNMNKYTENIILSFNTNLSYGATSINNEFIDKLIYGGKISNELKDKVLSKTKSSNRFGVELNYEFKYYNMKDTFLVSMPKYRYYIGFGSFTNISSQYSYDFFETLFYGNNDFLGETAHLGNSTIFQSSFRKISFGLINKEKHTSFAISLISGEKHNLYSFSTADLYTSPNGENITLTYQGKIENSDSLSNGFLSFSGAGIAFDFSTRIKKKINVIVQNLGFVIWGRNPSSTQIDNQYNFNGIEIKNIFDNNSFDVNNTIDSLLPPAKSDNIVKLLPAIFKAEKIIVANKKIQLTYGVRYKILSNYIPLVYVGTFYSFSKKIKSSIALTYGGYNNFEGRFNIYYATKKLYLGLGTNNLLGSFSKNGYGKSANFSLMTLF
jgi:hypothetical protein